MDTQEAIAKKNAEVQLAKALGAATVRLGKLTKARLKREGETNEVRQAVRILLNLAKRMAVHVENARLYESFAADVSPEVLLARLR